MTQMTRQLVVRMETYFWQYRPADRYNETLLIWIAVFYHGQLSAKISFCSVTLFLFVFIVT